MTTPDPERGTSMSLASALDDPAFVESLARDASRLWTRIHLLRHPARTTSIDSDSRLRRIEDRLGATYSFNDLYQRHMSMAWTMLQDAKDYVLFHSSPPLSAVASIRAALENAGVAMWASSGDDDMICQRTMERQIAEVDNEAKLHRLFAGGRSAWISTKRSNAVVFAAESGIDLSGITTRKHEVRPKALTRIMTEVDEQHQAGQIGRSAMSPGAGLPPWTITSAIIHGSEYPQRVVGPLLRRDSNGHLNGVHAAFMLFYLHPAVTIFSRADRQYQALRSPRTAGR